ncbi:MAG TPA: histidine triad nucleotide-binding protein [Geobacteraceae bacterium]|nr:histidine triad nucleotide-binding protein [Geobacteraceae bacterium]
MMSCLFCKIVSGEIPAKIVYQDDRLVAIEDVNPAAPLHLLLIPRKHIANVLELDEVDDQLVGHLFRIAAGIARERGIAEEGFRVVTNTNGAAGQSVFHIHFHLLAGRHLNWPPG